MAGDRRREARTPQCGAAASHRNGGGPDEVGAEEGSGRDARSGHEPLLLPDGIE